MVSVCHGQTDTIYTIDNKQIACNFTEIATNKVIYTLPGVALNQSIEIDQVHKLVLDEGEVTVYIDESDRDKDKKSPDHDGSIVIISSDNKSIISRNKNRIVEIDGPNIRVTKDKKTVDIKVR
jgi:hypothetical protein